MAKGRPRRCQRLTAAQSALAASEMRLARYLARQAARFRPHLYEELEAEAYCELVESAGRFDPSSGWKFSTYAADCIRWRLFDYLKKIKSSLPITTDPSEEIPDKLEQLDQIESMVEGLPSRQAELCRLIYRDGLNQNEVGKKLGMSRTWVSNHHHAALELLRHRI